VKSRKRSLKWSRIPPNSFSKFWQAKIFDLGVVEKAMFQWVALAYEHIFGSNAEWWLQYGGGAEVISDRNISVVACGGGMTSPE
jgi:hypothetical protein